MRELAGLHGDEVRAYFRERGWTIHMDDRPGQAFDPFAVLAESIRQLGAREIAAASPVEVRDLYFFEAGVAEGRRERA